MQGFCCFKTRQPANAHHVSGYPYIYPEDTVGPPKTSTTPIAVCTATIAKIRPQRQVLHPRMLPHRNCRLGGRQTRQPKTRPSSKPSARHGRGSDRRSSQNRHGSQPLCTKDTPLQFGQPANQSAGCLFIAKETP